jgi:hypothetical protein
MRTVRITDVPAAEFIRLQHHVDDLLREFEIIRIGAAGATVPVPEEVWAVTTELLAQYADTRASAWQQAEAAEQAGCDTLALEVTMPVDAADDVERLQRLFERADDLSRAGVLLTPEPAPELVKLRRRIVEEVAAALRER